MSASNNYLAVLAHICNCSSSISNRVAKKVLYPYPSIGIEKQKYHTGARAWVWPVCFSTLYGMISDSKIVIF